MTGTCRFYWLETARLAGSAYPGPCLRWLYYQQGIRAIISLEPLKPRDKEKAMQLGFQIVDAIIPDYTSGSREQRKQVLDAIDQFLQARVPVLVHCTGGLGRTGMILAIYLVKHKGLEPKSAIAHVRSLQSGSIEANTGQEEAIFSARKEL